MKDPHYSLRDLTRVCLLTDLTMMLAWSYEEAGKIIETYKIYEHKPPDLIMEKTDDDPHVKVWSYRIILQYLRTRLRTQW